MTGGMPVEEVLAVLDVLEQAGVRVWLEGGWGVDALVGRQTRPHRDLDIAVDAAQESLVLSTLGGLGYTVETDWRPLRVELAAAGRGWVDVHPVAFDDEGNGIQSGLNGERFLYPAAEFVTGTIAGHPVGCISARRQVLWHSGYEMREVDHHDLALLRSLLEDS